MRGSYQFYKAETDYRHGSSISRAERGTVDAAKEAAAERVSVARIRSMLAAWATTRPHSRMQEPV